MKEARDVQALLNQLDWVQRLARRLVPDAHGADDLAQEAMLAVLEAKEAPRSLPRFLSGVVRNLVWLRLRRDERRSHRERSAARHEEVPSTAEEVEIASTQRAVVEAVMELAPRYREVIVLRFFENQLPAAIASTLGVPVSTVKTRITRAQDQLRGKLDRKFGGRRGQWVASLALLIRAPSAVTTKSLWIPAGIAALVVASGIVAVGPIAMIERAPVAIQGAVVSDARSAVPVTTRLESERQGIGSSSTPPSVAPVASNQPGVVLRGSLRDSFGSPLPFTAVRFRPSSNSTDSKDRIAVSDADGTFEFEWFWPGGTVEVVDPGWITVLAGDTEALDVQSQMTVVAAPRRTVAGRIEDSAGNPLSGVLVTWEPPDRFEAALPEDAGRWARVEFEVKSNDRGEFQHLLPDLSGARVVFRKPGYRAERQPLKGRDWERVVLVPDAGESVGLSGFVMDSTGAAIADAWVSWGGVQCRSQPNGSFQFPTNGLSDSSLPLFAVKQGVGIAVREFAASHLQEVESAPPVRIVLARPDGRLQGVVTDETGAPLSGIHLSVVDPTPLLGNPDVWLRGGADSSLVRPSWLESLFLGDASVPPWAVSNEQGEFQITGLRSREYQLDLLDPRSGMRCVREADGEQGPRSFVLRRVRERHLLTGFVGDHFGAAVPRVTVEWKVPRFAADPWGTDHAIRQSMITGDDGQFWFEQVPSSGGFLLFSGPDILPEHRTLESDGEWRVGRVEVLVSRSARLQVRCRQAAESREFQLRDHQGEPLFAYRLQGAHWTRSDSIEVVGGRSETVSVPLRTDRVLLFRAGELVDSRVVTPSETTLTTVWFP